MEIKDIVAINNNSQVLTNQKFKNIVSVAGISNGQQTSIYKRLLIKIGTGKNIDSKIQKKKIYFLPKEN